MHDIIIAGGGIAGLTAAYRLRDQNILLLEEKPIPGGRTESRKLGEYVYNAGAQVIMGDKSPVALLADELGVPRKLINKTKVPLFVNGKLYSANTQPGLLAKLPLSVMDKVRFAQTAWKIRAQYRSLVGQQFDPANPNFEELNVTTMAEFLGPISPELTTVWNAIATISDGISIDITTPYHPIMILLHFLEQECAVVGGTHQLTIALNKSLGDKSQLDAKVTKVEEQEDHIEVTYIKDGTELTATAKHCVMAMPAPIVLDLIPALPDWKKAVLKKIDYASQTSAAFLLRTPSKQWMGEGVWRVPVAGQLACAITDPTFMYSQEYRDNNGQGLLRIYTSDLVSKNLIGKDRDTAIQLLKDDLAEIFPGIENDIIDADIGHWYYANAKWHPGHNKLFAELQAPTQRIHFCGDYTSAGYMIGSVQSAYRVANEITDASLMQ
ncbi:MAG: FAD-dependent oxidoreductase [Gammaproteobacteria bacterium]|nr:FAD-dependent oxidoreductase [Gammaproteobacteria bacterium]